MLPRSHAALQQADDTSPAIVSDGELVAAVQQREPGAERLLFERFAPLVRGLLGRGLGPQADIEDSVQEVFLRLFDRIGTVREPEAFRSFVVSVTMNELRVRVRKQRVRQIVRLTRTGHVPESLPGPEVAPAHAALRRFYAMLTGVNHEERTCFVLRHADDLELSEIAALLGLSIATVKRRLARATEKIMTRVKRDPFLADYLISGTKGQRHE